jgi:type IV secretory pathway protease TraF
MVWLRAIGVCLVGFAAALWAFEEAGLRINLAASMPVGLYRLAPCGERAGAELRPGDLVAVDTRAAARLNAKVRFFQERRYLTFTGSAEDLLLKEVAGVGGDVIEDRAGVLRVNGLELSSAASVRLIAAGGEALPQVSFPYRLAPGEIWLSSEHRQGIDSRYFAGVSRNAVVCRAEAVWTR